MFRFRLRNDEDYQGWKQNLEKVISKSNGALKDLKLEDCMDQVESGYKFWRFFRLSEDSFIDQAETGDVILCSNKKRF